MKARNPGTVKVTPFEDEANECLSIVLFLWGSSKLREKGEGALPGLFE
jgi:hypothetical protein